MAVFGNPGFDFSEINATKFAELWNTFDIDKSGFIEGTELDAFFKELTRKILQKEPTDKEFNGLKETLMSAYDIAKNGKISIAEIWRKYDKNRSGFITTPELQKFISDFVEQSGEVVSPEKITEYATSIMHLYDKNEDGLLDLKDMAQLLNLTDNFLLQFNIEDSSKAERRRDFEKIFQHYDLGGTGALEGVEIDGFVKDMMETIWKPISAAELVAFKDRLMQHCDMNEDGKIQKSELAICLGVHLK